MGEGDWKPEKKLRKAQKSVSIKREINYKRLLKLNICAKPLPTYTHTHSGRHTHCAHAASRKVTVPPRALCQEVNRQSQLFNAFRSACVGVTDSPVSFPALGACPYPCAAPRASFYNAPQHVAVSRGTLSVLRQRETEQLVRK